MWFPCNSPLQRLQFSKFRYSCKSTMWLLNASKPFLVLHKFMQRLQNFKTGKLKKSFLKDLVECQEYTLKRTKLLLLSLYWLVKQENCLNLIIFPNWPTETRQRLHFCPEQASEPHLFSQSSFLMIVGEKRRRWYPTPVILPGKSHGQRSLVGCRPWGHKELDTTE